MELKDCLISLKKAYSTADSKTINPNSHDFTTLLSLFSQLHYYLTENINWQFKENTVTPLSLVRCDRFFSFLEMQQIEKSRK